jgi:methylthioribose-1-phosphate isomerase
MHEIVGDLWSEHDDGTVVAITTNGMVNKVGRAVMPDVKSILVRHFDARFYVITNEETSDATDKNG